MRLDDAGRVVGFLEKPQTDEEMDMVRMDPAWIDARGIASRGRDCLASMGIYLFNRDSAGRPADQDRLSRFRQRDLSRPPIRTHRVQVHLFDGYWEDIGTIRSFYEANLALAAADRPFDLARPAGADLHPGAVPAPFAHRRRHGAQQPDRRRLHDRIRRGDREQRHRPALPHRQERDDPQLAC